MSNVLPLLERGVLSANLDREFPWWQASQAHEYFDAGLASRQGCFACDVSRVVPVCPG